MTKSESKSLPRFKSLDELVTFFDTQDLGEYWTEMPEAHFEVDIKTRERHISLLSTLNLLIK
ncbi:CopG antitoxin of type II toxin-antitoxin system [Methanophagales archaeon]|nr:CopG antitoxin of type II toxin-antitoxin system [Methanophagales archaeon]